MGWEFCEQEKKLFILISEFLINLGVICPFFFLGQFHVFLTQEKKTDLCFRINQLYQLEENKAFCWWWWLSKKEDK